MQFDNRPTFKPEGSTRDAPRCLYFCLGYAEFCSVVGRAKYLIWCLGSNTRQQQSERSSTGFHTRANGRSHLTVYTFHLCLKSLKLNL